MDDYKNINKDNKEFTQPTMRFKPRTDLERIYETINLVCYGSVKKEGVIKQLKNLKLIEQGLDQKIIGLEDEDFPDYDCASFKKTKKQKDDDNDDKRKSSVNQENLQDSKKKLKKVPNNKTSKRKFVDNSQARLFRKELENKTHFKATTDFSILKSKDSYLIRIRYIIFFQFKFNFSTSKN